MPGGKQFVCEVTYTRVSNLALIARLLAPEDVRAADLGGGVPELLHHPRPRPHLLHAEAGQAPLGRRGGAGLHPGGHHHQGD